MPDRISDAAVYYRLGYAHSVDLALGYLAALVSVFVAYVRAAAKSIGAPNDFVWAEGQAPTYGFVHMFSCNHGLPSYCMASAVG